MVVTGILPVFSLDIKPMTASTLSKIHTHCVSQILVCLSVVKVRALQWNRILIAGGHSHDFFLSLESCCNMAKLFNL